jgi:ferritin
MIKDKVLKALNGQIKMEMDSSYLYLAMSSFFSEDNLNGFASWFRMQSREEYMHAMKIFDYIHQANAKLKLLQIEEPKVEWKTALDAFKDTYKHEQEVTASIYSIVDLTIAEKDHATNNFIQWFVSEQVEEESTSLTILEKIKLVGDNKNGLFLLDRELGMRARAKK